MKFFICLAVIVAVAAASPAGLNNPSGGNLDANQQEKKGESQPLQPVAGAIDLTRLRKSAYGGSAGGYGGASSSIPAPPCPKNYIFSCQPNLAPIACASSSGSSYGSHGAYSAPIPTYLAPLPNSGYGVPQPFATFTNQYYQ